MTLGLVLVLLILAVGWCLLGRASAPTIAIVAQLPALSTVALITQYHVFFWFTLGLAVGAEAARLSTSMPQVPESQPHDLGLRGQTP
jgi:hypothetical protein